MFEDIKKIYEFTRGDLSSGEFIDYFFSDIKFREYFGEEFWLEIAECDYTNKNELQNLKYKLELFADSINESKCNCLKIKNIDAIDMFEAGEKYFCTITKIHDRGGHYWWLYIGLCGSCNQKWLIAQEERINDVIIFKRIDEEKYNEILASNVWPSDFDKYVDLLRIGRRFGNRVRFMEPQVGFSVYETVKDIATEEPNIRMTEIQDLINLDIEDAEQICKQAILRANVDINLKE